MKKSTSGFFDRLSDKTADAIVSIRKTFSNNVRKKRRDRALKGSHVTRRQSSGAREVPVYTMEKKSMKGIRFAAAKKAPKTLPVAQASVEVREKRVKAKAGRNVFAQMGKGIAAGWAACKDGCTSMAASMKRKMENRKVAKQNAPAAVASTLAVKVKKRNNIAAWWKNFRGKNDHVFSWFTKKRTAAIAAALVVCIMAPIVVSSAGQPAGGNNGEAEPAAVLAVEKSEKVADNGEPTQTPEETAVSSAPTETLTPEPSPTSAYILQKGDENEQVTQLQTRLMELGYMDNDEPTQLFGPTTKASVQLFERKHNLEIDGNLTQEEWNLLFSDQAQKYSVSEGISGQDVQELQIRLRELGYLDKVTSYYGTDTTAAVKKFQEANGLSADGTIGTETREMLYSEEAKANSIKYGEKSDKVTQVQERLRKLGYLSSEATGYYGTETVQAVRRFQERNGLIADGALGPLTEDALFSSEAQINALLIGTSGSDVEKVQQRLVELNYLKNSTGYYGSDTEKAVRKFQQRNGLTVDGKVGPQTNQVLFSDNAKKAASGSSSSSSSGSSSTKKPSSGGSSSSSSSSIPTANSQDVESLIKVAKSRLGCKYVLGAKGPDRFDCSGFVYWCLKQIGVKQGYMTSAGWASTTKYPVVTSMSKLQRGDIVSFKGHVGIYLGGGQMIDASSSDGKIRICSNIQSNSYWKSHFIKGLRVL